MSKKHQKHAQLSRPALGQFGRNEWAILGTPCAAIQHLAQALCEALGNKFQISYVDADHKAEAAQQPAAAIQYTDKIHFHRFDQSADMNAFQFRTAFAAQDIILVNGNHFEADRQIVAIDPVKFESLQRKTGRLTNVQLFLLTTGQTEIPDFLKKEIPAWRQIPVLRLEAADEIAHFIQNAFVAPPLKGLVLTGGKSTRMGTDKSRLSYHGAPQWEYLCNMLAQLGIPPVCSCREDQLDSLPSGTAVVADTFTGLGPFGALLSAFRQEPDTAWLVLACDLPLLDEAAIRGLLENRNISKIATAYRSPDETGFPEPLVAIWEPKSYPVLLQFLAQGYSCPRKVLINSPVQLVDAERPEALTNVNTPEELALLQSRLPPVQGL